MQWNLIRLRKEHDLTQTKLAELLGITLKTYCSKEHNKTRFNADEMFLLSDFFNLPIADIFLPTKSIKGGIKDE